EEKKRLSQFPVGQGLFFAGQNHVHIQVIASPTENELIVTTPKAAQLKPEATPTPSIAAPLAPADPVPASTGTPAPLPAQSLGSEPPAPQSNTGATFEWQNPHTA